MEGMTHCLSNGYRLLALLELPRDSLNQRPQGRGWEFGHCIVSLRDECKTGGLKHPRDNSLCFDFWQGWETWIDS